MKDNYLIPLAIIVPILFTLLVWLQYPLYGYDWSIHYDIAKSLVFENKIITELDWNVWYKYTPGVAFLLSFFMLFINDVFLLVKISSILFLLLFLSILLLVAREYNGQKKGKYWFVVLYLVIFGLFELRVYTASIHSQMVGFILVLMYMYFLFKKKYLLSFLSVVGISITHLMTSYLVILTNMILLFTLKKEKKMDILIFFSNLWIFFYWTKYNLSTSTQLLRIFHIQLNHLSWSVFFMTSGVFVLFYVVICILRRKINIAQLKERGLSFISFKSFFIFSSILSIGMFVLGYAIYAERHETQLSGWIFTNFGRFLLIPLILSGIYVAITSFKRKDIILLSFIIPLLIWVLIGPFTYILNGPFLSLVASQPLRALIYLSVPLAIIATNNKIKNSRTINYIGILYLTTLIFVCYFNPQVYNQSSDIPPYFFGKSEISSLNYIDHEIPENSIILTTFRSNILISGLSKHYNIQGLRETNWENSYIIITKYLRDYGILDWYGLKLRKDVEWIDKKLELSDVIYNNGDILIVKS